MSAKKVLFSAFEFYPLNNGGTFRQAKFAKYLQQYGWKPIVIAPDWNKYNCKGYFDLSMVGKDPCEVIRIPYTPPQPQGLKRQAQKWQNRLWKCWAYEFGELPEKMLQACRILIKKREIDALFVSSLPHFVLWIGQQLHKEFHIPWIADHRDIVDQEAPIRSNYLIKYYYSLLIIKKVFQEARLTRTASAITTVSEPLAKKLRSRNAAPVHVIMNGYDPDDFTGIKVKKNHKDLFQIAYFGSFFGSSYPDCFLDGLDLICKIDPESASKMRVWFYGKSSDSINRYITDRTCAYLIKKGGFLPHSEALKRQRQVDVLYLISHPSKGIVTGKIFEYINAGVPVISVPGDDDVTDQILKETGRGKVCRTAEQVCNQLLEWFHEWRTEGGIKMSTDFEAIKQYSRKEQARQLATLLDSIIQ